MFRIPHRHHLSRSFLLSLLLELHDIDQPVRLLVLHLEVSAPEVVELDLVVEWFARSLTEDWLVEMAMPEQHRLGNWDKG